MKMRVLYRILTAFALMGMAACAHPLEEVVDFGKWMDITDEDSFIPYAVEHGGELLIPQEDGTKATGAEMGGIAKDFFANFNSNKIISYVGTYNSVDQFGNPIKLSGRIVLPANGEVKRLMIMCHYTIASNVEAPSMSIPFESILAADGIGMIEPDYIGYGVTADKVHPYLVADVTAQNVLDMYYAALHFLLHIDRSPVNDDIFLYGFSQGGATSMCVLRHIEKYCHDIHVRLAFAGGGPYDICATYDKLVADDETAIPYAVPLIIQGMNVGCALGLDYKQYFKPNLLEHFDEWINSKMYQNAQITALIGSHKISDILTEDAMNKRSEGMSKLYRAMMDNSLVNDYTWKPQAPVYLFHSFDDDVVPYVNAMKFIETYQDEANLSLNIGHYGSHVMSALHCIFSARKFLKQHGEI